ncbi:MAG: phospholipase D family protein [Lautropia sp.]|nr:phospholipase D family protein [Lautropia sp.]
MNLLINLLKLLVLVAGALLVVGRLTRRKLPERPAVLAGEHFTDTAQTLLGQHLAPLVEDNPGLSGIHPLPDGHQAFAARARLADIAERSIDAQYYIWHNDISGRLLMQRLKAAADRGVRVRLLLDDNNTAGMDGVLQGLDIHPNVEVRLFNPFMQRQMRPLAFLSDFFRLNRRMHNKSFTVDNQATIVGGRNVGDEYFGAGDGVMFADLDVIAVGPVVEQVSTDFDRYWNSASTYPLRAVFTDPVTPEDIGTEPSPDDTTQNYLKVLADSPLVQQLTEHQLHFHWAKAVLVSDDPAKGLGQATEAKLLLARLNRIMDEASEQLIIVSPYFVPTRPGADHLCALARRGIQVAVLTNALSATDVAVVHSGYAKYRKQLLAAGVKLFELKRHATVVASRGHGGITGSSGASLHAKTFQSDGKQLFVGSFNMDPRSATLNTEMGLLIDSPKLATDLQQALTSHGCDYAYEVTLNNGKLRWTTEENGQTRIYDTEPHTTPVQRLIVRAVGELPIEWLL